jgi:hypothetical protein
MTENPYTAHELRALWEYEQSKLLSSGPKVGAKILPEGYSRPEEINNEPRCDCGHLFEICNHPNCPCGSGEPYED